MGRCVLESFLIIVTVLAVVMLAIVALIRDDARQHRIREEARPIADRIADIHNDAAFMVEQLQQVLQRHESERPEVVAWIPGALDLYRRLESLASSPSSSPVECMALSDDALRFVRERRIKGVSIAERAQDLAILLNKRNAA